MDNIPIYEQETTINLFPSQISKTAEVYTCMPSMVTKLRELAADRPDIAKIVSETDRSVLAEVDRSCVKISPPRRLSDEQRKAASERLAAARKKVAP